MTGVGGDGRDTRGRFTRGNAGGPGNPHGGQVSRLRSAILAAVDTDDIEAIVRTLVMKAREGDLAAAKEVLDRCVGPPTDGDLTERLDTLEELAESLTAEGGS